MGGSVKGDVGSGCECAVFVFFFFQAEDGIRDYKVTGVQTCALPISGVEVVAFYDTAGAAAEVARRRDASLGAVAGALAARRYGLEVVAERIEDEPHNQTRFLLVAREAAPPPPDVAAKTTLRLKLPHRPGTLARALAPFAEAGLNLTKLESRPDRSTPWEYLFYLDVEARADEPAMRAARAALAAQGAVITLLGEYARFAPRA